MPTTGFDPTISAGERPQTYALDRAATGIGEERKQEIDIMYFWWAKYMETDKAEDVRPT